MIYYKGCYIERISICAPESTVLVVGTHGDLIETNEHREVAEEQADVILVKVNMQCVSLYIIYIYIYIYIYINVYISIKK